MIREKKQGAEDTKAHASREIFGASWIVFPVFFWQRTYQGKVSTLKHAVVNNNKL